MRAVKAKRLRRVAYNLNRIPETNVTTYRQERLSTAVVPKPGLTTIMNHCTRKMYQQLKRTM